MAATEKVEAFLAEPHNVIVAGIRRDGRPHLSPQLVQLGRPAVLRLDDTGRVKYAIFRRGPAGAADHRRSHRVPRRAGPGHRGDPRGYRRGPVPVPRYPGKHGLAVPDDDEHLRALAAEGRVLLAITPDEPPSV